VKNTIDVLAYNGNNFFWGQLSSRKLRCESVNRNK